jgi:hypothetical protein
MSHAMQESENDKDLIHDSKNGVLNLSESERADDKMHHVYAPRMSCLIHFHVSGFCNFCYA